MSFFEELKRRNVFRVGIAYVLLGWVVLQAADFALDLIDAPNWIIQAMFIIGLAGLPIALFFSWAFELTPEGIKREEDVDRTSSVAPTTGRKLDKAIIAFLVLIVIGMGVERFTGGAERSADSRPGSQTTETAAADSTIAKSIAVLPFADLSQGGDQEWFADGLAEEILNVLAKAPDLMVASRTSAFSYKGTDKTASEIAEELGVAHVLEGSVRSAGDRIRVTAQLIRAEDGFHLWSENYDRTPEDIIEIQEDLALNIAEALETTMDPDRVADMVRVGTRSVEAYKAYLRGQAARLRAIEDADSALLTALEHYEAATRADPRFAAAYLAQADWWKDQLTPSYLGAGLTDLDVEALTERFTAAIDKAIEHAPSEIDRKGFLAQKAEVEVRLRDAIELYEDYLLERPNDFSAVLGLANVATMASDQAAIENALSRLAERGERDPLAAAFYLADAYDGGDPEAVAEYGMERVQQWPSSPGLIYQAHRALMWAGRSEEGASLERRYTRLTEPSPLMVIRQACIEGRVEDAEAALARIDRGDDDRWRSTLWLGLKILGRDDEASEALRPIAQSSSPYQIASTLNYAVFDPAPYPALMEILDRENVLRPPPREIPFRCPPRDETSIAVLPFVNMSGDESQEYFSDGISEEILNSLSRVPDLKVAGRTSSFSFKGKNEDLKSIGEILGVNHILEGSVRKAGNRVRISAQLVKAEDGFQLWSETFDRELDDVFAVQDEIASTILAQLEQQLGQGERLEIAPVDLAVYDQFLQGRQRLLDRNEQNITEAAKLFDAVIAIDPDYAPAHAQRAIAELLLANTFGAYGDIPMTEATATAEAHIEKALALDPLLSDAHAARGLMHRYRGKILPAIESLKKALEINPGNINAANWLHSSYLDQGDLRRALETIEQARRIDPLYVPAIGNVVFLLSTLGQFETAQAVLDETRPLLDGPRLAYLDNPEAFLNNGAGRHARAIQIVDEMAPDDVAYGAAAAFWSAMSLGAYDRALSYSDGSASQALPLSRLGRREEALQLLERRLREGDGVGFMIQVLTEARDYDGLVRFVDQRFDSMESFAAQTQEAGTGAGALGNLVYALRRTGDDDRASKALELMRNSLDFQVRGGSKHFALAFSRAQLAMLENDSDAALAHFERAIDRGFLHQADFPSLQEVFQPLVGDPRFDALIERMTDKRNEQRALLDLPPLELDA